MGAVTLNDSRPGAAARTPNGRNAARPAWRKEFDGVGFGRHRLRLSGHAPDWAYVGMLVPFAVAGNLALHALGTRAPAPALAAGAAGALLAFLLARSTRRRDPHARAMISALTAAAGAVARMVCGPMAIPAGPPPGSATLDRIAAATIVLFVLLGLLRELLTRVWPAPVHDPQGGPAQPGGRRRR